MTLSTTIYPYITANKTILGGVPIIEGTRISVRAIAGYYQMGMSVDEILAILSHLRPSQVLSALAYYFDHQQKIDQDLANASDAEFWKSQVLIYP
ncbi:hypothetical protein B9G53_08525 [Pseudanabaena sp. SR411]|uniref:DUF433 domain-containing protein n=1 Tax=Pseudanabaena sp. SR411 TaxID=1980935 RepID=UPI000B9809A4|nr:DUF433 domain-containing protein [Pseudanabaena sp. SR411]OYQ65129.1 hypothetical protein B9G53_08525 [Pseudanabaena sp. SR411]